MIPLVKYKSYFYFLSLLYPVAFFYISISIVLAEDNNEILISADKIEVSLDQDRAIHAVLTAYAPNPLELANSFMIDFTIRPTDELGQFIESNDTLVSYPAKFNLDANSSLNTGAGKINVDRDAELDLNQDGESDALRADFTYSLSGPELITINVQTLESRLGQDGEWETYRSGGFSLTLAVDSITGSAHQGGYSILYDDGSNELGTWLSANLRINPVAWLSE